ncbi:alkaline phosphatase PafA [Arenibacter sp. GZD96]|uniref:alkaline phosphatase PafA n=1 Tax=Aurantibrevibacter litoralis TaxID=3106030 RepID=UPI002AFE1A04|nr:alkaline phosphatase PafA [Arenibacter sp. GZD-96]MEA1785931.1 alkaline phosphatase PafA [Arenibacter sp. GZD-96]
MNRFVFILFVSILVLASSSVEVLAQRKSKDKVSSSPVASEVTPPRLVVGFVVDQMRYDYITRFWNQYGEGGLKRLVKEGYNCKNNHFNYAPTYTGPGHASVYTGTTPAVHGVIGNDWYDKTSETMVYCVRDEEYTTVGSSSKAGQMSPHRMGVTTLTDELRLHTQMRGKTVAIALKDRGAVLPGGHTANAAYWYEGSAHGNWITSSFYMDALPEWVIRFNASGNAAQYKKPWTTLRDIHSYVESGLDNTAYEGVFKGEASPTFPHDIPALWDDNGFFEILRTTPFGNSMTVDFALAALDGENLGTDTTTDFLAISFSSTDYVGHKYGVNSKEIEDTYLRLDQDLERLLNALDQQVGKGEYTVFLTADHAAIDVPKYLKDQKIPAGYLDKAALNARLNDFLNYTYGTADLIKNRSNGQLFLDHQLIKNLNINLREAQEALAIEMVQYEGIAQVYTAFQMWENSYSDGIAKMLQNGYHQKRSGDVLLVVNAGVIDYPETGSTHGSPQVYDTHVPLIFYGKGIQKGATTERTEIPDIAPTIASLLGIAFPSGTTGRPISKVLE